MYYKNKNEYFKLLTILITFLVLIVYGLILTVIQSFGKMLPVESNIEGFEAYKILLTDKWFINSAIFSINVAFKSTIFSMLIGSVLAYWIWKQDANDQKKLIVYKIPLILPHIVAAFFVQLIFSKSGLLSAISINMGLIKSINSFPELVYSEKGTGIILAYIYKEVPFVILFQLANYSRINKNLLIAAKNLGASNSTIFRKVILPDLIPTINSTMIIIFLYTLGAFEIPFLLGASRPEMIPVYIFNIYFNSNLDQRPLAMAALTLLFLFSSIFITLYYLVIKHIKNSQRAL